METISNTYYLPLVLLSIIIAIIASFAALNIGIRINRAKKLAKLIWLLSGAFAMGMGIWSMHFIAMLAFHLAIPVSYNTKMVIVSVIPAVISSGLALFIISRPIMSKRQVFLGSFFIAAGIVSMHYTGMAAMEMGAEIVYNPYLWVLSAIIAFIASLVAICLLFYVSHNANTPRIWLRKVLSAFIMGFAISGMHYAGMSAASFKPHHHHDLSGSAFDGTFLAYTIGISMLIIFALVFISIFIDTRFESQSIESERKFRSVIESANDAIILADKNGRIISWNNGAQSIFGYEESEVVGNELQIIIAERFRDAHRISMERYLISGNPRVIGKTVELNGVRKSGDEFPIELSIATWLEEGNIYFSSIIRDITERKHTEEKINQMVYIDPLTGLSNRLLLNEHLSQAIDQANETKQTIGVMFLDLDRFKYINDTLGHAIGDQLLIEVANRILTCLDTNDKVYRQGGDEFIFLLPNTNTVVATEKARKIVELFSHSFMLNGYEVYITPSIGIAIYPADGSDLETLIKNADTAMYRVKEQGKNNFQFYTKEMNDIIAKKMKLEVALRKALVRNEFKVFYQPQINVITQKLIGVEALIRWQHPELGMIPPNDFIPLAEETGLIIPIGEWVLHEACRQNKTWQNEGHPKIRVSVNISSRQFHKSNLVAKVKDVLNVTKLNPKYLELELTESIIQDTKNAISTMYQLKEMGIHLSIDDFGTGYSSLSYLKTLPINNLKIDQSFIRNILTDSKDASLVESIINMAHNLDLKVIAEGVENIEHLHFLKSQKCNEAQGYLISRPIPAEEMLSFFKEKAVERILY